MQTYLYLMVAIPFIIMVASMFLSKKQEKLLANLSIANGLILLIISTILGLAFAKNQFTPFFQKHLTLYSSPDFDFAISYYFDQVTWVFATIGALIFIFVSKFSQTYMHRDEGYKRFYVTLNLFVLGYMITVIAGNFETLFIGWEALGICSFLLISFYRDRYLPAKNALKVISYYRLGDVCLILALWACHHVFHKNISFDEISTIMTNQAISGTLIFAVTMLIVAALIKSAGFPFSSWLPRAMEGPTSSSAIFYGSLSVHLGIFLLIRSYPLWADVLIAKIILIILGIITTFVATQIASVQSTVKTQIAYASIAQIGLMIIEVALGWHGLALAHFAFHAIYRSYQLLISPSVMNYQIHDMFFHFKPSPSRTNSKLHNTLYALNIKEWNMDTLHARYLWQPFKTIGRTVGSLNFGLTMIVCLALFGAGLFYTTIEDTINPSLDNAVTYIIAFLGLSLVLIAFATRQSAIVTWSYLILGQCFVTLSVFVNEHVPMDRIMIYMSGIVIAALLGFYAILQLRKVDGNINLNNWHSFASSKPLASLLLLLACLALLGFPFTPTFLGIDLLYTHLHTDQYGLVLIISLCFIFIELAALRMYARLCLGLPKGGDREIAWRSS